MQAPKSKRIFEINKLFEKDLQSAKKNEKQFPDNRVTTTSYNSWNFIPKNLFLQFSKTVNAYFLFLILL